MEELRAKKCLEGLRIINVASDAYVKGKLDFTDLFFKRTNKYDIYQAYANSKLALIYFTLELNFKFAEDGVKALAAHPGMYTMAGNASSDRCHILYTALIWSAENFAKNDDIAAGGYLCYFKFAHSSTQTLYLLLNRYIFEGCYFGAIMGSAKIAKQKSP